MKVMDLLRAQLTKRRFKVLVILFVLILIFNWFSSHAYIEVTVETDSSDNITYQFARGTSSTSIEKSSKTTRELVSRGSHEIIVRQGNKNAFGAIKTGGFLSTSSITMKVAEEKGRKFVGNDPQVCMRLAGEILVSFDCAGSYSDRSIHVPATSSRPGYVQKNSDSEEKVIQGFYPTKEGTVAINKPSEHNEAGEGQSKRPHYTANTLINDIELSIGTPLNTLGQDTYSFQPYKEGFLAAKNDLTNLYYYSSTKQDPEKLSIGRPEDERMQPYALTTYGDTLVAAFVKPVKETKKQDTKKSLSKQKIEVIIHENNQDKHYNFGSYYSSVRLCSKTRLCLLTETGTMDVFDVSGSKAKLAYSVRGVFTIQEYAGVFTLATQDSIVAFNPESGTGNITYSFDTENDFCGIYPARNSYLVCVRDTDGKKSVLYIDQGQVSDDIDKKVTTLKKAADAKNVNISGNIIYVRADAGERKYVPGRGYILDPKLKEDIVARVTQEADKAGIDRSKYQIFYLYSSKY